MAHLSEDCKRLYVNTITPVNHAEATRAANDFDDVMLLRLPAGLSSRGCGDLLSEIAQNLGRSAVLIVIGEVTDLVTIHKSLADFMQYQLWIAIKRSTPRFDQEAKALPAYHAGATVYTKYKAALKHTQTRIQYTYCPACDKTTKDYGGKKHTYHEFGTLISDVWRDIACDVEASIEPVVDRFADLFGLEPYQELRVVDLSRLKFDEKEKTTRPTTRINITHQIHERLESHLISGDCLDRLKELPDNSIDFVFADPPYNLGKKYRGYSDDLAIKEYFSWCDKWISELARVLRPGRTLALLNIPLWTIRHFQYMERILQFQNWIAWDALSYPVRRIMPAHYTILCFSKGDSRPLPGLTGKAGTTETPFASMSFESLQPQGETFCLRSSCVKQRHRQNVDDRGLLTDLWWDIHRIKHNTRRVDHPTQLPPQLMYRLISIFTQPDEIVLDCFNGSGTTTLAAHQLQRRYIGIEKSQAYFDLAVKRHGEIEHGLDPFRKEVRLLTAKNSPVERLPKRKYAVSKKTLQLEVKRISELLGRLPTREDVMEHSKFPIEYYDEYFISWGEVRAAARTTGMTEDRYKTTDQEQAEEQPDFYQPRLL